jgi:dihydrolipoamide dehydrogenase
MQYDVIIIGAGPAGYVAAIRAGQVGLRVALVEKQYIGGMCLNWGCIPTKALIESGKFYARLKEAPAFGIDGIDNSKTSFNWSNAVSRSMSVVKKLTGGVEYLLRKNGVDVILGEAVISSAKAVRVGNRLLETDHIIIATGSYPARLPFAIDPTVLVEVENLSKLEKVPENIVIYGQGAYAIELAQFFNLTGHKVSLLATSEDLIPHADAFLLDFITKKLKSDNINLIFNPDIKGYKTGKLLVNDQKIDCDMFLNCSWRHAVIPGSEIAIDLTTDGYISTDDRFETSVKGIFAIGDVNGISYLAHVASAEGIWVINYIKGIQSDFSIRNYPLNMYTNPEMAQIGMTEKELKEAGIDYKVNEFPLSANGKAMTEGNTEGLVRLLSDNRYGQVLGTQIIASNATDMIAEASAFIQMEGTIYDVAQTIHAHPTVSEIFMEAGFDAVDKAIHK